MKTETKYGRIKLEVRIDYQNYLTESERDEIINDIKSLIEFRNGGCVNIRDTNHEPNFNICEGMGCWFIKDRFGRETAITK